MIGYILLDYFKKFFMGKKLKDEIDKACDFFIVCQRVLKIPLKSEAHNVFSYTRMAFPTTS